MVAHTLEEGFSVELATANRVPSAEGGSIRDVGVCVLEGMNAKLYIGFIRTCLLDMRARATEDKDVKAALSESMNWIMTMPLIHSQLYECLRLVKIITEYRLQGTLKVTGDCGTTFKMEFDITDD